MAYIGQYSAATAFVVFWLIIWLSPEELGLKRLALLVLIWAALLAGAVLLRTSHTLLAGACVALQALFDIILLLSIFGGDINIRRH